MESVARPRFLVVVLCLITLSGPHASAQDPASQLAAMQKRFHDLSKDLLDFAKVANHTGRESDYHAAYELLGVAQRSVERATLAYRLVEIHGVVCETDRSKVRPILLFELDVMDKAIDLDLEETNLNVSATQNQAIVQRGGDLRSELRTLQGLVRKSLSR